MKRLRKLLAVLAGLAAVLCLTLRVNTVRAQGYTFTVRVFAGNQGTIDGGEVYKKDSIKYGDTFRFSVNDVKVTNADKYYAKGIRYAGNDNDDMIGSAVEIEVKSDIDLVITYGVKGEQVDYTVKYVSYPDGGTLASAETFHGNVGDKPVVAYRHIEGYVPRYRNITGTLTNGDNEFVFEYTKFETGGGEGDATVVTTTTVLDGGTETTVVNQGNAGNGGGQNVVNNPAPAGNNNAADTAPAAPAEADNSGQDAAQNTTEEILDMDVPLAGNSGTDAPAEPAANSSVHLPLIIGGAAGIMVLIGILAALLARFGKRA